MTKQQPFATKLRLSKICRWLMTLGLVKLSILVALVAGYPLPELSLDFFDQKPVASAPATSVAESKIEKLVLGQEKSLDEKAASRHESTVQAHAQSQAGLEPQGSNAVRAATQLDKQRKASQKSAEQPQMLATAPAPDSAQAPVQNPTQDQAPYEESTTAPLAAAAPQPEDQSWWGNILQITTLPFPRLGVDQAAHAASLDTPPPPSLPARGMESSPFVPPSQAMPAIPRGQNPDGSPLAPRSTTARPLPAGAAGPQLDSPQGSLPSVLVPNDRPPTPRVDTYVPPEDPNRKQQELARREQEVLMLKQQMEQRLSELQAAERKVQDMLEEAKALEQKKISNLTAMYTNMKPKQAAKALESLDERIAVKILSSMAPKQSGEILTYTDPKKTAKLTELISRMRLGQ